MPITSVTCPDFCCTRGACARPDPRVRAIPPGRPATGDAAFHRETTIHPERPAPGTTDLVASILAGYAYHLNVMPLDARMPDPGALVRAVDIAVPDPPGTVQVPVVVLEAGPVRVTAVAVTHGRAVPALAYRFDTADGAVVFSGDTTVNDDLIALARGAGFTGITTAGRDGLRRVLPRVT
jgi:hypothetical protein